MAGLSLVNPMEGAELHPSEVVVLYATAAARLPPVPPRGFRVFHRAYAARPTVEGAVAALTTGCYPHASARKPAVAELLKPTPVSIREYRGGALPQTGPTALVVVTAASGEAIDEPTETSIHVPLWIRGLGFAPASDERLVSLTDIVPTLLAAATVAIPPNMQGRSLSGPARELVFAYGRLGEPGEWRALIRGFDKIVVDRQLTITHLYNLALDPEESNNLADSLSHGLLRDELRAHLRTAMRQLGDQMDPSGLKRR